MTASPDVPTRPATVAVEVWLSDGPRSVRHVALQLPAGSTLADAVRASGLLADWTPEAQDGLSTALWGKPKDAQTVLREGDRVELLRGLKVDPKEARRQRYQRDGLKKAPRRVVGG